MTHYMTVVPAYGKDYASKKEALEAWEHGEDFIIRDISSPDDGRYIDKEDADKDPNLSITIRYKRLTQIAVVPKQLGRRRSR